MKRILTLSVLIFISYTCFSDTTLQDHDTGLIMLSGESAEVYFYNPCKKAQLKKYTIKRETGKFVG